MKSENKVAPNPPKSKKEKKKKEKGPPLAPVWKFYKYCNCLDFIFMIIGTIGTVIAGMGMPIFAFLFKELLNSFNPNSAGDELFSKCQLTLRTSQICRSHLPRSWRRSLDWVLLCVCFLGGRVYQCRFLLQERVYEGNSETGGQLV